MLLHLSSSKYVSLSVVLAFTKSGIRCRGAQELLAASTTRPGSKANFLWSSLIGAEAERLQADHPAGFANVTIGPAVRRDVQAQVCAGYLVTITVPTIPSASCGTQKYL